MNITSLSWRATETRLKAILVLLMLAELAIFASGQETSSAWNEIGNFLYGRGMYTEAFQAYEEAVALDPDLISTYELKGLALNDQCMYLVESGSMYPNLDVFDLVTIEDISTSKVITWDEGEKIGYISFNDSGDIICYRPYGKESITIVDTVNNLVSNMSYPPNKATPIIHRVICWVEEGEPMWNGGPAAPFSGYITKGDNNSEVDQNAGQTLGVIKKEYFQEELTKGNIVDLGNGTYLDHNTGIPLIKKSDDVYAIWGVNYLMPVREEWIIGVAREEK